MPAWLGWVAVVLLSLYLAIYPALATGLAWRFGRDDRVALVLVLGGAWAITEWLRGTMFTGFPWNPAAAALAPTPLITIDAADRHLRPVRPGRPARRRRLARILQASGCRWSSSSASTGAAVAPALLAGPARSADRPQRPHRPAQHRPAGQVAPGLRRGSRAAARHAVRPADRRAAPAALARSRDHRSARGRAHRRASGARRSSSARARRRCSGPNDVLLTGGIAIASHDGVHVDGAANSIFALGPGGADRRPLRQGAPRALRRISADAAAAVRDRPVAPRAGRHRLHAGPGPAHDRPRRPVGQGRLPALLRDHLLGPGRRRAATGPTSSSIRRTTPGSAAGARRSISPRRGSARPRKACRCSARRRPGSAP